jgi:hypothetical protein
VLRYLAQVAHAHHEWLAEVTSDIAADYVRLHDEARHDPQRAGHGGESTWARLLEDWLPPQYEVATRKYVIPEERDEVRETDIVVFSAAYPQRLRQREEILAAGVAAAFSVKLTLDADGIRDGVEQAIALHRGSQPRFGTPRGEMVPAFPVGLLAHSHVWRQRGSSPERNVNDALVAFDQQLAAHPREMLDYVCVADLNTWTYSRMPYLPPWGLDLNPVASDKQKRQGAAMTAVTQSEQEASPAPVAIFIAGLILALSYTDPTLRPLAEGLRLTDTLGRKGGLQRLWPLDAVFSDHVAESLSTRGLSEDNYDWHAVYF